MTGFPIWIIPLILALLGVRGYQMWQANTRKKQRSSPQEVASGKVSSIKFRAELRPSILSGLMSGQGPNHRRGGRFTRNNAIDRMNDLAETLNPTVVHTHIGAEQSARRLVKGIAGLHDVAIFISTRADQATDNERIILDVFETLKINPKIVDVSSDADMHLGLPQSDGQADLPYLYIDGIAFGNIRTILDASRNGDLTTALTNAGVTFDTQAAAHLQQR